MNIAVPMNRSPGSKVQRFWVQGFKGSAFKVVLTLNL
jgi:hypothetical protein